MTDTSASLDAPDDVTPKASKLPLILGVVLAFAGAGAGFYATWTGMLFSPSDPTASDASVAAKPATAPINVAYVEVAPLTVSLSPPARAKHLIFRASLEVAPEDTASVEALLPRVTDVLNSYLRALSPADLEDPAALARLRAQMLRRVQVVAGLGKVNDLLIMEFVLN